MSTINNYNEIYLEIFVPKLSTITLLFPLIFNFKKSKSLSLLLSNIKTNTWESFPLLNTNVATNKRELNSDNIKLIFLTTAKRQLTTLTPK